MEFPPAAQSDWMFEACPVPLAITEADSRLIDVNRAWTRRLGFTREAAIGRTVVELGIVTAEELSRHLAAIREQGFARDVELTIRNKSGERLSIRYSVEAVQYRGRSCLFSTFLDETERLRAERRLAAKLAVARSLAEAATLADASRKILQTMCETAGWEVGAFWLVDGDALRCEDFWHLPSVKVPHFEEITRRFRFRRGIGLPGRVWSTGEPAWIPDVVHDSNFPRAPYAAGDDLHGAFGLPILQGDRVFGVIEFFARKVLEPDPQLLEMMRTSGNHVGLFMARRRAEEELARSNADLEQFAAVASHDLQEPLRMVASYVQLLERRYKGKLDADADTFIHYASDGARRMQTMINDLLAYARVRRSDEGPAPVDCAKALQNALANLRSAIQESGAVVTAGPLPETRADARHVAQLFQNLISNAIKFRGERPPRVDISAERDGGAWIFCVRDNGIGIEPEWRERIFGLFQRPGPRRDGSGSGIGLAICRKIVEIHGGRLWVESEPGQGSAFRFTLPVSEDA